MTEQTPSSPEPRARPATWQDIATGRFQGKPLLQPGRGPNYPHKIFSLSEHYMPKSMSSLFDLCSYFFTTSSLVHPTVFKMSEYPITKFIYEGGKREDQERMRTLIEKQWTGRRHLIETGLYYHCFGNCITLVVYVCKRYLRCPRCNQRYQVTRLPFRWINWEPDAECPSPTCGYHGAMKFVKIEPRHQAYVRPLILDPRHINIRYNPVTGRRVYIYRIPAKLRMDILRGDPYVLEDTPDVFIEAVKKGKMVELDNRCLHHFIRPGLSSSNDGFGMPLITPVMQDLYYQKTLRRAQEAIALAHIVPLMIIFPQASAAVNPARQHNMGDMVKKIESQLARGRRDPNYIPIMPTPIGIEHVGGDARALLITPELEQVSSQIINGMLAPQELVKGGLTWSGSSISLRIVENHFLNYRNDIEAFLEFATARVCSYLRWPNNVKVSLAPFKMADDIQRLQLLMAASQSGAISNRRYLQEMDIDIEADHKQRIEEIENNREFSIAQQRADARAQGEAQVVAAQYQVRAQQAMAAEEQRGASAEAGVPLEDPMALAHLIAELMISMPEQYQAMAMERLAAMPTLYQMVQQALAALYGNPDAQQDQGAGMAQETVPMGDGGGGGGGGGGMPSVSPGMPDKKPPTRTTGGI